MKKLHYILLFVLLVSVSVKAQSGWVTTKLDDKISVKFPADPQKMSKGGFDVYSYKGKDSVAYIANVIDLKVVANLDSATLSSMKDNQEFADQIKMGMATKMAKYTLGDIKIGKWKTYTIYNVAATENTTKGHAFTQMILIGSKMYTLACIVPANLTTKNNELFFNSAETLK